MLSQSIRTIGVLLNGYTKVVFIKTGKVIASNLLKSTPYMLHQTNFVFLYFKVKHASYLNHIVEDNIFKLKSSLIL